MAATKRYSFAHGSRQNIQNTVDAIKNREPFKTGGSLLGDTITHGAGRLNPEELQKWQDAVNFIDYVIYSYATPIAWHVTIPTVNAALEPDKIEAWYIVPQKFSQTTTRQQSFVSGCIGEGAWR